MVNVGLKIDLASSLDPPDINWEFSVKSRYEYFGEKNNNWLYTTGAKMLGIWEYIGRAGLVNIQGYVDAKRIFKEGKRLSVCDWYQHMLFQAFDELFLNPFEWTLE